jgi:hypothetical protein
MEIILKLLPFVNNIQLTKIYNFDKDNFEFRDLLLKMLKDGFKLKYFKNIKFLSNGYFFDNPNDIISSEHKIFILFTNDEETSDHLISEFYKYTIDDKIILSDNDISDINEQIKQTITPDLITVLNIFNKNPNIIKLVHSYLSNNNIEKVINIDSNETKYKDELNYIIVKFHNFNWEPNLISSVLNHYNGHINMTLKYLINYRNQ